MPDLTWFYFICVLSATVLWKDYNGTLEESLNNFEKSIGLYTEVDTTEETIPPFYIDPFEEQGFKIQRNRLNTNINSV